MSWKIKIAPQSTPNARGLWIDVPPAFRVDAAALRATHSWVEFEEVFGRVVPRGHMMVAYRHSDQPTERSGSLSPWAR